MANYESTQDILNDLLFRAGEPTNGTSDFDDQALVYVNRAYQGIWSGGSELDPNTNEVWHWLKSDNQGTIIIQPEYSDGTVNVSNNSNSIAFSSAPSFDPEKWFLKVDDFADVFEISSFTTPNATLDSVYTGKDDSSASYRIFKTDYTLADDVLYLLNHMYAYQDGRLLIEGIGTDEMRRRYPRGSIASGVPHAFSIIGYVNDTSAKDKIPRVRFSHSGGTSSTDLIRAEYEYIKKPDDLEDSASNYPLIPHQYRRILADWGLAFLLQDKEDTRAQDALTLAGRTLAAMVKENHLRSGRISSRFGRIIPREGQRQRALQTLRTETGHIIG